MKKIHTITICSWRIDWDLAWYSLEIDLASKDVSVTLKFYRDEADFFEYWEHERLCGRKDIPEYIAKQTYPVWIKTDCTLKEKRGIVSKVTEYLNRMHCHMRSSSSQKLLKQLTEDMGRVLGPSATLERREAKGEVE